MSDLRGEKAGRGTVQSGIEISLERLKELLKEAARIGELGEDIVIKYEKKRLFDEGKHQLSEAVRQISIENVAAGYDILSLKRMEAIDSSRLKPQKAPVIISN